MSGDLKLTQKLLNKPSLLSEYANREVKHPKATGLRMRIGAGGYVTFLIFARLPGCKYPVRKAFGMTQKHGKYQYMTLREAETQAALYMSEIRHGVNPFDIHKEESERGPALLDIVDKWASKELVGVSSAEKDVPNTWPTWTRDRRNYYIRFIEFIEKQSNIQKACLADFTQENARSFLFQTDSERIFKNQKTALSTLHQFIVEDIFAEEPKLRDVYEMSDNNNIKAITRTFKKPAKRPFYRLTAEEVNQLLQAFHSKIYAEPKNWMHYYAMTLCIYNGLRISEAMSLKSKDDGSGNFVNFDKNIIEFRDQKNQKLTPTRLLSNTRSVIEKVRKRKRELSDNSAYLFSQNNKDGHITYPKCRKLFNNVSAVLADEFDWTEQKKQGVSLKKLRNTFATLQAENKDGFSLEETSTILRHSSIEVTRKYYIDPHASVISIDEKGGVSIPDITEFN